MNKGVLPIQTFLASQNHRRNIFIILLIGLITFGNALFNGFVWDDFPFILNNPEMNSLNPFQLFGQNKFNMGSYYRPISALYFSTVHLISGNQPFLYHFIQITLHIINAMGLYVFISIMFEEIAEQIAIKDALHNRNQSAYNKNRNSSIIPFRTQIGISILALFSSLVFLVHPINTESVSYIAASQSVVFFLFGILALISISASGLIRTVSVCTLLLLSVLTKETGALFLLMALVYIFLFKRGKFSSFIQALIGTGILYLGIRFFIGGIYFQKFVGFTPIPIMNLTFEERMLNVPMVVFYYLKTTLFPTQLLVLQHWIIQGISTSSFYIPLTVDLLFFACLVSVGIWMYKANKNFFNGYVFFLLWFLAGTLMISQILPIADATVADRWFYFPLAGLIGLVTTIIASITLRKNDKGEVTTHKKILNAVIVISMASVALLSIRTIIRNADYRDEITLYSRDSKYQNNALMESDLAIDYLQKGDMQEAFKRLKKSVQIEANSTNLFNLGLYYEINNDFTNAIKYYDLAAVASNRYYDKVKIRNPKDEKVFVHLIGDLLLTDQYEAAAQVGLVAVRYYPDSGTLWEELAVALIKLQRWDEALSAATKAKSFIPGDLTNSLYEGVLGKKDISKANLIRVLPEIMQNVK